MVVVTRSQKSKSVILLEALQKQNEYWLTESINLFIKVKNIRNSTTTSDLIKKEIDEIFEISGKELSDATLNLLNIDCEEVAAYNQAVYDFIFVRYKMLKMFNYVLKRN